MIIVPIFQCYALFALTVDCALLIHRKIDAAISPKETYNANVDALHRCIATMITNNKVASTAKLRARFLFFSPSESGLLLAGTGEKAHTVIIVTVLLKSMATFNILPWRDKDAIMQIVYMPQNETMQRNGVLA